MKISGTNNTNLVSQTLNQSAKKAENESEPKDNVTLGSTPEKEGIKWLPEFSKGTDPSLAIITTPAGALIGGIVGGVVGTLGLISSLAGPMGIIAAGVVAGGIGIVNSGYYGHRDNLLYATINVAEKTGEVLLGSQGFGGVLQAAGLGAAAGAVKGFIGGVTFNN